MLSPQHRLQLPICFNSTNAVVSEFSASFIPFLRKLLSHSAMCFPFRKIILKEGSKKKEVILAGHSGQHLTDESRAEGGIKLN